jgi:molecular chaperone GrpE
VDGVRLVEKKMMQVLVNSGLEPVDAAGKAFDPNTMEALATVAAESADEDEVVADVFQPGYLFRGNLIRPARVRVKQFEA